MLSSKLALAKIYFNHAPFSKVPI